MDLMDIIESLNYIGTSSHVRLEFEIEGKGYEIEDVFKIRKKIKEFDEKKDLFQLKEFLKKEGKKIRFYKTKKWLLLRKIK